MRHKFNSKSYPPIRIKHRTTPAYDNISHPLLSIKLVPDSLIELRKELLNHPDIISECSKPEWSTFELAIGRIGQMLNIVMDGDYEPNGLFIMLTEALKNRKVAAELHPHLLAPGHGLKEVELQETESEVTLVEIGEGLGFNSGENIGTGPYTVCDNCITSYDCCEVRGCKLGTPAVQLERTVKKLKETIGNKEYN